MVVVTTLFADDEHLFPALRAGAQGYLLKDQPEDKLSRALEGILRGEPPLSPAIAQRLPVIESERVRAVIRLPAVLAVRGSQQAVGGARHGAMVPCAGAEPLIAISDPVPPPNRCCSATI